jgi:hypothetical protein
MIAPQLPRNAYTDAPELHPNIILGSLQLLFWIIIHPAAWTNYVAGIDPALQPDFTLADLRPAQWKDPALRRLLVMVYVVWTGIISLITAVMLWLIGVSSANILVGLMTGIGAQIIFGLAIGATLGLVVSLTGNLLGSSLYGIAAGLMPFSVVGPIVIPIPKDVWGMILIGWIAIVSSSLTAGISVSVANRANTYLFSRRIGSLIVGGLIGILIAGLALSLTFGLKFDLIGNVAFVLLGGAILGVIAGIAIGVQLKRWLLGWLVGFLFFLLFMLVIGVPSSMVLSGVGGAPKQIALAMAGGATAAAFLTALIVPAYLLAERLAGPSAGAIASALASGLGMVIFLWNAYSSIAPIAPSFWQMFGPCLVGLPLGLTLSWWMPVVLYPLLAAWNLVLLRADARSAHTGHALLRYHSAFWDEQQRLPLIGLDDHVVLIAERSPAEGRAALAYLSTSRQRWAAQAAQIELDARELERCPTVQTISAVDQNLAAGALEGPASALLRSFSRISQDVDAALRQESAYNQRLALSAVEDRLDGLLRELTRSSERYAARFRPVATHWRQIVAEHIQTLAAEVEQRQEIDSPYIIGVPLTEQQEVFVGRADISARIEQLLLDRRRPPLLLYGQRRMGKTSLLNNLGRLLPSTIIPLFVDLQGPAAQSSDHIGLLYNLGRGMIESAQRRRGLALPPLSRDSLAADPFTRFDEWLNEVEAALGQSAALLTLDEFEALDSAISRGRFEEERVLGMLRNLIQHRPRFKVLLAGSHTLDELQRWASYLINVQVVQIDYLKDPEARQLVERPVKNFALRYEPEASQRVLDLTRGHPFLIQLLCAEIVALKNEQQPSARRLACLPDVEAAVPEALSSGSLFFADIQRNQIDADGQELLRFLATYGKGAIIDHDTLALQVGSDIHATLDLLARRELIEFVDGGCRFQVELIRRWFAEHSK